MVKCSMSAKMNKKQCKIYHFQLAPYFFIKKHKYIDIEKEKFSSKLAHNMKYKNNIKIGIIIENI